MLLGLEQIGADSLGLTHSAFPVLNFRLDPVDSLLEPLDLQLAEAFHVLRPVRVLLIEDLDKVDFGFLQLLSLNL